MLINGTDFLIFARGKHYQYPNIYIVFHEKLHKLTVILILMIIYIYDNFCIVKYKIIREQTGTFVFMFRFPQD